MLDVIVKNEFFKLSKQKKPLVFLILNLLLIGLGAFTISKAGKNVPADDVFKMLTMGMSQVIIIFGILTVAETLTEDCKNGTIKISAVQPVNRSIIVLGKMVYVAITVLLMYLIVMILSFILTSIFIGVPPMSMVGEVLKSLALSTVVVVSFLSIVGFFAVLFTAPSLVTTVGIAILFLSGIVVSLLPFVKWIPENTKYFFVTEYFTAFFGKLPDVANIKVYATVAIAVPLIVCIFGAIKIFQRKELNY